MKTRILYVERKPGPSPSIERVFRQIASDLPPDEFEVDFQAVPHATTSRGLIKNLAEFRPREADIYHVTGDVNYVATSLPAKRTVLTIHDLFLLRHRSGIRRSALKSLYLLRPLRHLDNVTAISEATRDEIISETGELGRKVRVIENPLVGLFRPRPQRPFDASFPVILHIGTAPNKNLETLVEALRTLPCRLRILGKLSSPQRHFLDASGVTYTNATGLGQAGMEQEYRACDIVSFCTTYEGFGLPIIEAQVMRKPLLTSDIEPMRSIAGNACLLVDPHDPAAIHRALRRLIEDPALRERIKDAGEANMKRFEPKRIAIQYADLYRKMVTQSWRAS